MDETYFRTENLDVGYGGTPLIRDICISLQPGHILALIGPNGAGKTTILKSIIRELPLVGGKVYIRSEDASLLKSTELAKRLSVMLTTRAQTEFVTCRDVVSAGRYPYTGRLGILSQNDREKVQEAMELVGIQALSDRDYTCISDGQRQRVLLARALCQEPELLVLDEPTSFLDIRSKLEFLSLIQFLSRQKNMAVILSLHELDLAQRVADKVVCVKGDHIARFGAPEEIFLPGVMEELYGISTGSYSCLSGSVELAAPEGEPQVFVIAGLGCGTPVYRILQRKGIPFSTGILWENDLDIPASSLAARAITQPAFTEITEASLQAAREEMERCENVICALPPERMTGCAGPLKGLIQHSENILFSFSDVSKLRKS